MQRRQWLPGSGQAFSDYLAERRARRRAATAARDAPDSASPPLPDGKPRRTGTFTRTAAHYWHHQRKAARAAGNRYPTFVQVPGPWRVAKLGAVARARQRGMPRDRTLARAWLEWLFTRPKVLLTASGTARLAMEVFSVVVVLGTLWGFWNEWESRREDRINAAWTLIAGAKQEQTGNLGLADAISTLRGYGIDDFTGLFLPGAHLRGVQLAGATLHDATLEGSNLGQGDLSDADLLNANLSGALLWDADLRGARLNGADFGGAGLGRADLSGAWLVGANLSGADLWRANLEKADLSDANLTGANLKHSILSKSDLRGATLSNADLENVNLSGADLRGVDLSGVVLYAADFSKATIAGAKLSNADLFTSNLQQANMDGADLSGADMSISDLSEAFLGSADLSGADLRGSDLSASELGGADLSFADLRGTRPILFANGARVGSLSFAELCGADRSVWQSTPCADLGGADLRGTPFGIDAPGPDVLPAPDSRR